jgi:hypothetical protein
MSDRHDDPETLGLRDTGKFCPVHRDLVDTLGAMNRKLNILILAAFVCASLVPGKDVLAAVLGKVGG